MSAEGQAKELKAMSGEELLLALLTAHDLEHTFKYIDLRAELMRRLQPQGREVEVQLERKRGDMNQEAAMAWQKRAIDAELKLTELAEAESSSAGPSVWKLFKHKENCGWATPLPTGEGYWGCNCGLDALLFQMEDYELVFPASQQVPLSTIYGDTEKARADFNQARAEKAENTLAQLAASQQVPRHKAITSLLADYERGEIGITDMAYALYEAGAASQQVDVAPEELLQSALDGDALAQQTISRQYAESMWERAGRKYKVEKARVRALEAKCKQVLDKAEEFLAANEPAINVEWIIAVLMEGEAAVLQKAMGGKG